MCKSIYEHACCSLSVACGLLATPVLKCIFSFPNHLCDTAVYVYATSASPASLVSLTLPPPFSTWRAMLAYRYSRTRGTRPRRAYDLGSLGLRWFSITAPGPKVVKVLPEPV